jgi:hypothetical protein
MTVIAFPARPAASSNVGDLAECPCGSAWFELRGPADEAGAVVLNGEGSVTGYSGFPHCVECGQEWLPAHARGDYRE